MIIPQQATYEVQDQKYVFVVDSRGYVHSRPIKIAFEKQGGRHYFQRTDTE